MNITRKKQRSPEGADRPLDDWVLRTAYRERNHRERQEFLRQLRQIVQQQGSQNLIYKTRMWF